jgi:hypothetical protein
MRRRELTRNRVSSRSLGPHESVQFRLRRGYTMKRAKAMRIRASQDWSRVRTGWLFRSASTISGCGMSARSRRLGCWPTGILPTDRQADKDVPGSLSLRTGVGPASAIRVPTCRRTSVDAKFPPRTLPHLRADRAPLSRSRRVSQARLPRELPGSGLDQNRQAPNRSGVAER